MFCQFNFLLHLVWFQAEELNPGFSKTVRLYIAKVLEIQFCRQDQLNSEFLQFVTSVKVYFSDPLIVLLVDF